MLIAGLAVAGPRLRVSSQAGVPAAINYQGRLTDPASGQVKPDGSYNMVFRIYDSETGGGPLWTGTYAAANGNPVTVGSGIFTVLLGSGTGNSLSAATFGGSNRWIEVQVGNETLTPRQRIGSVPYALQSQEASNAANLGGLAPSAFVGQGQADSITSSMLMTAAVSSNALADNSVTTGKIFEGTIVNADISSSAAISPAKLSIYGDGSAGSLNVAVSITLTGSTNFTDCNIQSGATLTVQAGTVIRCTGSFTNSGTIQVSYGAQTGRSRPDDDVARRLTQVVVPGSGDASGPAGLPEFAGGGTSLEGGKGGNGLPIDNEIWGWHQLRIGGGGGTSQVGIWDTNSGGGLFRVMAKGNITSAGNIRANGVSMTNGGGGGGGGIVILASSTSVANSGNMEAKGGNGGSSDSAAGPGGGGLVMFVAPSVSNSGTSSVAGGQGGAAGGSGSITSSQRRSGGGGGGSVGAGGQGGNVTGASNSGTPGAATSGMDGRVTTLVSDPATMWP